MKISALKSFSRNRIKSSECNILTGILLIAAVYGVFAAVRFLLLRLYGSDLSTGILWNISDFLLLLLRFQAKTPLGFIIKWKICRCSGMKSEKIKNPADFITNTHLFIKISQLAAVKSFICFVVLLVSSLCAAVSYRFLITAAETENDILYLSLSIWLIFIAVLLILFYIYIKIITSAADIILIDDTSLTAAKCLKKSFYVMKGKAAKYFLFILSNLYNIIFLQKFIFAAVVYKYVTIKEWEEKNSYGKKSNHSGYISADGTGKIFKKRKRYVSKTSAENKA